MDYQLVKQQAVEFMLDRGWKQKIAKRRTFEQSLYDHTLTELDALITLLPLLQETFVPPLTDQEERVLLAGVVAHDVGKELDEWQEYILGRRDFVSDVNRDLAEEVVPQLATRLGFDGIEEMLSAVVLHMRHERTPAKVTERLLFGGHSNPRWKTLAEIVDAIDNVCSAKGLFAGLHCLEERSCLSNHLCTSYHLVQLRGVSTTLLHRAVNNAFTERGWSPLLHYSNGTIYVTSSATQREEPPMAEIERQLADAIKQALSSNMAPLIVGNPLQSMIPKPDLFDYRDLRSCLSVAARRINRANFPKKPESARRKTVTDYLALKGDDSLVDAARLALETSRVGAAQPEMCIFKFFKAALAEELVGQEVTPEAATAYAQFAEGGGKKKAARVTPQSVARAEYDAVFGDGAYNALQATSTLMPARDMALTIDAFWSLDGGRFGLDVARVGELLDHAKREQTLIDAIVSIADKVYAAVPETNRPTRATPVDIAKCFLTDLIHPAPALNLFELVAQQMRAYAETKANARRDKGWHLCPVCNLSFEGGTEAKADFVDNPDAHTNRAVSHSGGGKIVICEACKYERFLQQLLLGSKVADVLVLFPRMNIGHSSGEALRRKAIEIWEMASRLMTEANPEPDLHLSLGMSFNLARKLSNYDVYRLTPAEIVSLLTYESKDETKKQHRKDLEGRLKELYGVENRLTVEELNAEWDTGFATVEEALTGLIENKVNDDEARKVRAVAFRLYPQLYIACQTPHMILVPLYSPIQMKVRKAGGKMEEEAEVNAAIRQLYVTLILGLALDCSVAVVKAGEVITFEGGEGVARVPPTAALRDLVGAEWVSVAEGKKWLEAISAVALLASATNFPERSNLYAVLRSMTTGHIMRRIEQQEEKRKREGKSPFSLQQRLEHIGLLETLKEVVR
jgi:hypothetical protein